MAPYRGRETADMMNEVEDRVKRRSKLNGMIMVVEDCAETENSCW